jgi:hypothetical protein
MAKRSGGLMLFPRGFYGAQATETISRHPRPFAQQLSRLANHIGILHQAPAEQQRARVNENVESLYAHLITHGKSLDDFEFRKELYVTALAAFGTQRFDEWYLQQQYSPAAGELHQDFLNDTLRFIDQGERQLSIENWNSLLVFTDHPSHRESVMDEHARAFFGISGDGLNREPRNAFLIDVLPQWLSHPGGHADLLNTLHILFGTQ